MAELFSPLLPPHRSVITITKSGYIKRMPVQEFEAQRRGGKGKAGAKMSTDQDGVAQFFSCNDHDTLLFITDRFVLVLANVTGEKLYRWCAHVGLGVVFATR
jgi:DNA gyrase/topoisomerase IV subunit A